MNNDCIFSIICFLGMIDNINVSTINKQFYIMSKSESIWKSFYNNDFYNINCLKSFYNNYKKCHILNKFLLKNYCNVSSVINNATLDLFGNQLQSIPLEIGQLGMLETLELSYNQLES